MTYIRELPMCAIRFGRTDIIEIERDGVMRKTAKIFLGCGYREVEPEECICCGGFTDVKIKFSVDTFIRLVKGKWFRNEKFHGDWKK